MRQSVRILSVNHDLTLVFKCGIRIDYLMISMEIKVLVMYTFKQIEKDVHSDWVSVVHEYH